MSAQEKTPMLAAREKWWRELTLKGDPARRPDLTWEAFEAGWNAALAAAGEITIARLRPK